MVFAFPEPILYITYVRTQEAVQTMSLRVSTLEFEVPPDGNQDHSCA